MHSQIIQQIDEETAIGMKSVNCTALQYFVAKYENNLILRSLQDVLENSLLQENNIEKLLGIYKKSIPSIEQEIWRNVPDESIVARYQEMFREMEELISTKGEDDRYEFIIIVPVADRPQHLRSCLNSLLELCKDYNYGGRSNGKYNKVSVIIADDSKEKESIERNKEISIYIQSQGIDVLYYGISDQLNELDFLSEKERSGLKRVLGNKKAASFFHKGSSITRNIVYLKLNKMIGDNKKILIYFIDSDQEFKININTKKGGVDLSALNYFYELDEVFTKTKANILTGKVVGDPPVSPAVMVGNYIGDVIHFLRCMAEKRPDNRCQFHKIERKIGGDAAYHDMAGLFGFLQSNASYSYNCPLEGVHDNSKCLEYFAEQLNRFFYGEHLTRKTYFSYEDIVDSLKPARTIYTGNYIFKPQALKYFIPFAALNLRMAGPVLGRIIKSEIQERFVSVNLPMLHKRTLAETGQSEFRIGLDTEQNTVDLSGEFERQFFGDVMLFTIEKLADMGYPGRAFRREFIEQTLTAVERKIHRQYKAKHVEVIDKLQELNSLVRKNGNWWNKLSGLEEAKDYINSFMRNVERNFGVNSICYDLITSKTNKKIRKRQIIEAISTYSDDRRAWQGALSYVRSRD